MNNDRVFNFDQANTRLKDRSFILTTMDRAKYAGEDIDIRPDSTRFLQTKANQYISVPTSSLSSIRSKDHTLGAVSGFFLGLGLGAVSAIVRRPTNQTEAYSTVIFFVLSSTGGTVIGTVWGADEELIFQQQEIIREK
jgi:hypothetical protein